MRQYFELLQAIKARGTPRGDRTGTGTTDLFGYQMRIDLAEGFPLLTTKQVPLRLIIHELLWFLKGETNIKYLVDNDVHIWDEWPYQRYLIRHKLPVPNPNSDEWKKGLAEFVRNIKTDSEFADKYGDLGPVYGSQWRSWPDTRGGTVDQIAKVIDMIKKNPESRRLIVSAWNPAEVDNCALPPCHCLFQFHVADGKLSCQLYQRSADVFLGVPFNIASYSLLLMMIAQVCGLLPGEFIHSFGSVHIYDNHKEQVDLQLGRDPLPLPAMRLNPTVKSVFDFQFGDFTLEGYKSHAAIKAPVAV